MLKGDIKGKLIIVLLLLVLLPSVWMLFVNGFIKTDDGDWMVIRFSAFYQALRDGQFPVRLLGRLNYGYGYPVSNFLYPGFMYLAVPFKVLGFDFLTSIKLVLGASVVLSGIFTFFWLNKLFDKTSSFFGAILYVYLPYHLYDLTRRGSAGELLSLALLPFTLWQVERRSLFLSALGIAALIISHNTLAILFLFLIIAYMWFSFFVAKKSEKRNLAKKYIESFIFGFSISAFFWIPALLELPFTIFNQTKISSFNDYFADFSILGPTTLLIFFLAAVFFIVNRSLIKRHRLTLFLGFFGIISIFLSTSFSAFIWAFLPVSFIQFPFRFLSVTLLCSAFLFAFVLSQTPVKYKIAAGVVVILLTIFFSKAFLTPNFYTQGEGFYSTNEATTTVMDEYMPKWVKKKPDTHFKEKAFLVKGSGKIENTAYNSKKIMFYLYSDSGSVVRISSIYYPGWKAEANGKDKAIFYDNPQGLMDIKLGSGKQNVILTFVETPFRLASDIFSFSAFLVLIAISFKKNIFKKAKK